MLLEEDEAGVGARMRLASRVDGELTLVVADNLRHDSHKAEGPLQTPTRLSTKLRGNTSLSCLLTTGRSPLSCRHFLALRRRFRRERRAGRQARSSRRRLGAVQLHPGLLGLSSNLCRSALPQANADVLTRMERILIVSGFE
ncbi:uncharacterized protein LOC132664240 [Panthera onca]